MTTTQNKPAAEVSGTYPRSAGPRRRSKGDQSLGALLAVYVAVLVIAALLGGFLVEVTRSAS